MLILVLLDIKREHKIFWTEWWQALLQLKPALNFSMGEPATRSRTIQRNRGQWGHPLTPHWNFKTLCVYNRCLLDSIFIDICVTQFGVLWFGEQQ